MNLFDCQLVDLAYDLIRQLCKKEEEILDFEKAKQYGAITNNLLREIDRRLIEKQNIALFNHPLISVRILKENKGLVGTLLNKQFQKESGEVDYDFVSEKL
jgi:hypothetical protein